MANAVFGSQWRMADVTFYSGPFATAAPPENLIKREPSVPLILTDLSDLRVEFEFPAAIDVNLLAVLYCDATSAATLRWRGATSRANLTAAPGYDSGSLSFAGGDSGLPSRKNRRHDVRWLGDSAQSYSWWRLDISDAAKSDGRLIIGNVVIDAAWQPGINIAYGGGGGLMDPSRKPRSEPGQVQPLSRSKHRILRHRLSFQSEDDMYGFADDLDEQIGTTEPLLFVRDPEATTYRQEKIVFGLQNEIGEINDQAFNIYEKAYVIEELIP